MISHFWALHQKKKKIPYKVIPVHQSLFGLVWHLDRYHPQRNLEAWGSVHRCGQPQRVIRIPRAQPCRLWLQVPSSMGRVRQRQPGQPGQLQLITWRRTPTVQKATFPLTSCLLCPKPTATLRGTVGEGVVDTGASSKEQPSSRAELRSQAQRKHGGRGGGGVLMGRGGPQQSKQTLSGVFPGRETSASLQIRRSF